MMIIFWKGKGILVLAYIIFSFIGVAMLVGVLQRNVGGIFSRIDFYTGTGIGLLVAAGLTYLTKDEYYKDRQGNRKKMDTVHEFFFIQMKYWVYILAALSLLFLGNLVFGYFAPGS